MSEKEFDPLGLKATAETGKIVAKGLDREAHEFLLTRISHLTKSSLDPPTSFNSMNKGCSQGDGTKQREIQWVKRKRPRYASILTEA